MTPERTDVVVILARGESRRMGRPKPGLRLPGDDRTFLERIVGLYRPRGWPVILVLGPAASEGDAAADRPGDLVVLRGPAGGDTALTLATAHRERGGSVPRATHWWAHPVDLPLVAGGTVDRLATVSRGEPDAVVRPTHGGRPGHPVVVPDTVLARTLARPGSEAAPFRDLLAGDRVPVRTVDVPDRGVVTDFDTPGDLASPRDEGGE